VADNNITWSHHNPVRVVASSLEGLAAHIPVGTHVLLVTSAGFVRRGVTDRIAAALPGRQITVFDDARPNPDLRDLDVATMRLRSCGIGLVLALGGGSAIDAAKALSVTLPSAVDSPLAQAFRGGDMPAWERRLPLVVIPTTSGAGAEVTPFATVWDHEQHRKHSLAGPLMFPDVAFLDASLTLTLPEQETLFPGLDTVSHALESLWNRNCTPVSRALALQSLALSTQALAGAVDQPANIAHRRDMQSASLLSGMAISQTRTAIAHSISYPITTHFGVPHGLACSFTLPVLLRKNLDTMPLCAPERQILTSVLQMLLEFDMPKRMRNYLALEDLRPLHAEMFTPGRADNYKGVDFGPVATLLDESLG
jgi:phosphonate metabolism-associated iron-containing alcohol dehydrogenase